MTIKFKIFKMLERMTADAMATRIKDFMPSLDDLSVVRSESGNAIITLNHFIENEPLQLGLNLGGQYFVPLKSWTDLDSLETEAEIGFQLAPAIIGISANGTLQQTDAAGNCVQLTEKNLIGFAEHLLALYRFWFASPAFRGRARSYL